MQKKILSVLLAIVMILTIAPVSAFAEDDILSYLNYKINNGEVTITGCDDSISGEVMIPDTIEGYPVMSIGEEAFSYCDALTSVTIPDCVTSIGDCAFYSCDALTSITIGNGKVTPADARLALRAAAGLDTIAGVYETAANFDEKDTISTSDARMILRKAAGLK